MQRWDSALITSRCAPRIRGPSAVLKHPSDTHPESCTCVQTALDLADLTFSRSFPIFFPGCTHTKAHARTQAHAHIFPNLSCVVFVSLKEKGQRGEVEHIAVVSANPPALGQKNFRTDLACRLPCRPQVVVFLQFLKCKSKLDCVVVTCRPFDTDSDRTDELESATGITIHCISERSPILQG